MDSIDFKKSDAQTMINILCEHYGVNIPNVNFDYGCDVYYQHSKNLIQLDLTVKFLECDILHEFAHLLVNAKYGTQKKRVKVSHKDSYGEMDFNYRYVRIIKSHGCQFMNILLELIKLWFDGDVSQYKTCEYLRVKNFLKKHGAYSNEKY